METATKTVEQLGESFSEPSMQERFEDFAKRSSAHSEKEKKERQKTSGPREVDLKGRPDEEREFIEAVAQKDESEKKSPAKGSAEKDSAKPNAKESEKPEVKAGEKEKPAAAESNDSPSEPLSGDLAERHWQGKLQGKEIETHINQVNSRAGIIMEHVNQSPHKTQIEQGFRAIFAGRPPAEAQGFFRDLATALAEVPRPDLVFEHIALQPQDREVLRNVKTPKELRAAIQTISKHYPAAKAEPSPKPRAPRPPSEVGGRGAAGDDAWKGMSFGDFATRQNQRYAR